MKTIKVAAPRREAWNDNDRSSRIVLFERNRLHPANPQYGMPAEEICISEGEGVAGDPGNKPEPWVVWPTPKINGLLRDGRLVEVKSRTDTSALQLSPDDLVNLGITKRAISALEGRGVSTIPELAEKIVGKPDPEDWLSKVQGIGESTARDIVAQLQARSLL